MNSDERPKIIDNPNRRSLKVWSERLGRYYYKSKNPNYYNEYFHKTKGPRTCEICIIFAQEKSNMSGEETRTRDGSDATATRRAEN